MRISIIVDQIHDVLLVLYLEALVYEETRGHLLVLEHAFPLVVSIGIGHCELQANGTCRNG